jgi:hypothetical protein
MYFLWKTDVRESNLNIWEGFQPLYNIIFQNASWRNMTETIALENSEIILNVVYQMRKHFPSAAFHFQSVVSNSEETFIGSTIYSSHKRKTNLE